MNREFSKHDPSVEYEADDTQQLVEILGEIGFLRERLSTLEDEAERLKEMLGRSP